MSWAHMTMASSATLVVPLADPRRREAEALVQLERGHVADPHLQGERRRGHGDGVAGQRQQQAGADAGALLQRVDRDVRDVRRVGRQHQPAVADEASPDVGHQVAAGARDLVDLAGEHRGGPGARVHLLLDLQDGPHVAATHAADAHDEVVAGRRGPLREDLHEADLRADSRVTQLISASGSPQVERLHLAGLHPLLPQGAGVGQLHQRRGAGLGQPLLGELDPAEARADLLPVAERAVADEEGLLAGGQQLGRPGRRRGRPPARSSRCTPPGTCR